MGEATNKHRIRNSLTGRIISTALSLTLALSLLPMQAFATDIVDSTETPKQDVQTKIEQPGNSQSNAILTAAVANFDVTVPTILPITVDSAGKVFTSTEAKVMNQSSGPIKVDSVEVISQNNWELVGYGTDFSLSRVGLREYGIQFNGNDIPTTGLADGLNWGSLARGGELPILYNANISPQKEIITDLTIANVIFTIGWDEADFTISDTTLTIEKGIQRRISLEGIEKAAWDSSNETVATVDQTGLVTAVGWGSTTITAKANDITRSCEVTIPKILNGVTLNQTTATLYTGSSLQLTATAQYRDTVQWSSSNPSVATVTSNGLVKGVGTGTAVITATTEGFSGSCSVSVKSGPVEGEEYVSGNYKYIYGRKYIFNTVSDAKAPGWSVKIIDKTKTSYTQPLEEIKGKPVTNYNFIFYDYTNTVLRLNGVWANKNVTDMASMFQGCRATTIDLSSFNTTNVTNMNGMFTGCAVNTLDLSSFNTSNVTNMSYMFNGYQSKTIDLSSFNTSKVTNMQGMFCNSKANTLYLSNFNTGNVTDMRHMFENCSATTGYVRTQSDANKFNASSNKPSTLTFRVK